MQYPVIDLITQAYLNNGWTGLDIIQGINLFNKDSGDYSDNNYYINNQGTVISSNDYYTSNYIEIKPNTSYFWAINGVPPVVSSNHNAPRFAYYDNTYTWIVSSPALGSTGNYLISPPNAKYIRVPIYRVSGVINAEMLVEETEIPTEYTPYATPKNDFPNRLKLPLPRYFPHPVIDALQRAAAGTQTADDTEILRHYLTPLGIGGI